MFGRKEYAKAEEGKNKVNATIAKEKGIRKVNLENGPRLKTKDGDLVPKVETTKFKDEFLVRDKNELEKRDEIVIGTLVCLVIAKEDSG